MDSLRVLDPYPNGWYVIHFAKTLANGQVKTLTFMGQEVVLFRTQSGMVCVMDAHCPHLGAHLGYGGRVVGECIQCPFHGFRFDISGECTYTPYGRKLPPKAHAKVWPCRESNGLILVYYHREGLAPGWEVPALEMQGWSPLLTRQWELRAHPQETTENSVDIGHFGIVHGYRDVEVLSNLQTDGPHLSAKYAMTRPAGVFGKPERAVFEVHAYGLGYSLVNLEVPAYGLCTRLYVMATPIEGERITLRIATHTSNDAQAARINPLLAPVPGELISRLIARLTIDVLAHDVQQDFVIWQHKRYLQPPILADGDGPVGPYRLWARQFYRDSEVST